MATMPGMQTHPKPRVWFRGGKGPIYNRRCGADETFAEGQLVAFGEAMLVVQTDCLRPTVTSGQMYALHGGGEWNFPRADAANAAPFGQAYRWDPAATGADGGTGAMVAAAAGEAVHALVCEAAEAGATSVIMQLLQPAASAATT